MAHPLKRSRPGGRPGRDRAPLIFIAASKTEIAAYNVDIAEVGQGRFRARCRETRMELISVNAEHDFCHTLTVAGWPDGRIQFWRGSTPILSHSSIHKMGRYRIALGEQFPQRVKRKEAKPEIASESVAAPLQNRETKAGVSTIAPEQVRP